jgi:hypothetical protein
LPARIRSRCLHGPLAFAYGEAAVPRFGTANYPGIGEHGFTVWAMVLGRELLMNGVWWEWKGYVELGLVWASMAARHKANANGEIVLVIDPGAEPHGGFEFRSRLGRRKDRPLRSETANANGDIVIWRRRPLRLKAFGP